MATHILPCRRIWSATKQSLLHASHHPKTAADRHRSTAPVYSPGLKVWLPPRYVGTFDIVSIINTAAVRLRLPSSIMDHPVFHIFRLKPVVTARCPSFRSPFTYFRLLGGIRCGGSPHVLGLFHLEKDRILHTCSSPPHQTTY